MIDTMEKQRTILIVDDDANILEVAGFAVRKAGYTVVGAHNGLRALEIFKTVHADLVVLDSDPRAVEPTKISDISISETWMDGNQVFEN